MEREYEFKIVVPGRPMSWARPRTGVVGGRRVFFNEPKVDAYRKQVAAEAHHSLRWNDGKRREIDWPRDRDCARVRARFRPAPERRDVKCRCAWCSSEIRIALLIVMPDKRSKDFDRVENLVLDALEGVLYWNDRQAIVETKDVAYNAARPRLEISVRRHRAQESLELAERVRAEPIEPRPTDPVPASEIGALVQQLEEKTHADETKASEEPQGSGPDLEEASADER